MFVDESLEREREGRRCELVSLFAEQARLAQRVTEIVREADDDGDWRAAGCSSSAQWLAQISGSDHRTAVRITETSVALRSLPALDHALSTGALTLDQVAAAVEFATRRVMLSWRVSRWGSRRVRSGWWRARSPRRSSRMTRRCMRGEGCA
jgi:hypothetical protein